MEFWMSSNTNTFALILNAGATWIKRNIEHPLPPYTHSDTESNRYPHGSTKKAFIYGSQYFIVFLKKYK